MQRKNIRQVKQKIKQITRLFQNNQKIAENYFFMTFANSAGMVISLLLYPYLIRVLGKEAYGSYVLALSAVAFFSLFISFGFNLPALKQISLNQNNLEKRQEMISFVFTAKALLFVAVSAIFILSLIFIPFLRANYLLYIIAFATVAANAFVPNWYFQGVQKMKVLTLIQVFVRILGIPFIFLLVKTPYDVLWLAAIYFCVSFFSFVLVVFYLKLKEGIAFTFVRVDKLKTLFKESVPLFWTSLTSTAKLEGVTLIIGTFISVADVAIYDLARKIINILQLITRSINTALFPKAVSAAKEVVRKIIFYQGILGAAGIAFIALIGYPLILLLGGDEMTAAYPLMLILSVTLITWMLANCYISFVFVPSGHYNYILANQIVAVLSFVVLVTISLLISRSIYAVVIALALSSFFELFYCTIQTKRKRLL